MTKIILCVLAQLVFFSTSFGQSPAKPLTGADLKAQQELNKKALLLLSETIQQSRQLKNKENHILAKIALADLLWKDQEASARRLYQEAFEIIRQARDGIAEGDPESFESEGSVFRLRDQLLRSVGQHDPTMAKDLLSQTKVPQPGNTGPETASADSASPESGQVDGDTYMELALAVEAADKNPEEAVRVARKALGEGYSHELTSLLLKLEKNHPELAGELAVEIANKLRMADFDSQTEAVGLALFLVADAISSLKPKPAENKGEGDQATRAPLLQPQFAREFLEFIIDAAGKRASDKSSSYLLFNLRSTAEELEAVAPAPAARLKQLLAEFDKENEEVGSFTRLQELVRTNDVEALLETARTTPPPIRDSFYVQAATAAWEKGDQIRANEIATKNISNPFERTRLLLSFQEQTVVKLIAGEDFDQARQLISRIRSPERRVGQLMDLSAALRRKNDKKGALAILIEAQSLLPVKATKGSELEQQIRVAGAFSEMDVDRSFALHASAIDQISDLLESIAKVAGFTHAPISIRDNEFAIESYTTVPGLGMLFSRDIRILAQTDFERTKRMFDRFQRLEIRVAAYLYMSRTILETEEECDCACEEPLKKPKQ